MEAFQAVIHNSQDVFYRSPFGAAPWNTKITVRLKVSRGLEINKIWLRLWEKDEQLIEMHFYAQNADSVIYQAEFSAPDFSCLLWYYFILDTSSQRLFYQNNAYNLGGMGELSEHEDKMRSFQITVYNPAYATPAWTHGAVMYQIFPDRFFRAGKIDFMGRKAHLNWEEAPQYEIDPSKGYYPADDFFGGNFSGIESKLMYLKELGVNVIYFNPIFKAYSNHRYDTGDYEQTDELLGTNEEFSRLCEKARALGIRIILDGVFSHTGSNSRYFNREGEYPETGAYQSEDSPYYSWYSFEKYPDKYDCWWGVWSLPCVNEMEPSYLEYILGAKGIVRKWLRAGASGWRLDVADELPDEFIKQLRVSAKECKEDTYILGEVWEDASNKISYSRRRGFLLGDELDGVMNYPLREAVIALLTGKEDARMFAMRINSLKENYPRPAFYSLMNFLSTHDTVRIITLLGGAPEEKALSKKQQAEYKLSPDGYTLGLGREKAAAVIIYMMPGLACIYYGDEAGMEGYADPFNRAAYCWGRENEELRAWYGALGKIREEYRPLFAGGEFTIMGEGALLIKRTDKNGQIFAFINPNDTCFEGMLDKNFLNFRENLPFENDTASEKGVLGVFSRQVKITPLLNTEGVELTAMPEGCTLFLPPYGCGMFFSSAAEE